jgi:hypothetical protein
MTLIISLLFLICITVQVIDAKVDLFYVLGSQIWRVNGEIVPSTQLESRVVAAAMLTDPSKK